MAARTSTKLSITHTSEANCVLVGILEQLSPDQPTRGRKIALILHGAAGHKDYLFQKRLALRLPLDSFRFDFRGSHESSGVWRQGGLDDDVEDISVVTHYLQSKFGYEVDLVVGHSRGSVVAMRWLCTSPDAQQVSAFINASGRYRMEKIYDSKLYVDHLDALTKDKCAVWRPTVARKVISVKLYPEDFKKFAQLDTSLVWDTFPQKTDVLTLHGLSDTVVPPYDAIIYSRALSNRRPGTHSLNLMEDADHNFSGRQDEVVNVILEWWNAHLRKELVTGLWTGAIDARGRL